MDEMFVNMYYSFLVCGEEIRVRKGRMVFYRYPNGGGFNKDWSDIPLDPFECFEGLVEFFQAYAVDRKWYG